MDAGIRLIKFTRLGFLAPLSLSLFATVPTGTAMGDEHAIAIAVQNFVPGSLGTASEAAETADGRDLARMIISELRSSNRFAPIDPESIGQRNTCYDIVPQFAPWRDAGVEYLVSGQIANWPRQRIYSSFRLWNVTDEKLVVSTTSIVPEDLKQISHTIADEIVTELVHQRGKF
jgi:TolB protein